MSKLKLKSMILPMLMIVFTCSGVWAAADWSHNNKGYEGYGAEKVTFCGDGVIAEKIYTVKDIEAMAEGKFEGVYTMRTLVEPHTARYQGIAMDYLLKNAVGLKDTARNVKVVCADGISMEFSLAEIMSASYINEADSSKLKVILAYGKNGYPLVSNKNSVGFKPDVSNDGGPLRLMVGQTIRGERNSPKCLQNVVQIMVSTKEKSVSFSDLGQFYSWAQDAINALAEDGVINGVAPGKFAPEKGLTRAEFAKILTLALKLEPGSQFTGRFKDVAQGAWYAPYVEIAGEKGLINGYEDGTFKPSGAVNRQEMTVMVIRAMGLENPANVKSMLLTYKDNEKIPAWAAGSVAAATEKGLLENIAVGYFNGKSPVNRAEAAVVVYRMQQAMK